MLDFRDFLRMKKVRYSRDEGVVYYIYLLFWKSVIKGVVKDEIKGDDMGV